MNERKKIRVGLLVDGEQVTGWVHDIVSGINALEGMEICCVLVNDAVPKPVSSSKFIYRLLRKLDRFLFSKEETLFRKTILPVSKEVKRVHVLPVQKKYSDIIPEHICNEIRKTEPDLLLRFGFRILKGEILTLAPYGVLSLHHGDTAVNRGGPPAFWEVVNREPATGVTLQQLNNQLDGGRVLNKAIVTTDPLSFHRNQCHVYTAGVALFLQELRKMAGRGVESFFSKQESGQSLGFTIYDHPLYKDPSTIRSLVIFGRYVKRLLFHFVKKLFFIYKWVLLYKVQDSSSAALNLYQFRELVPPKEVDTWADPFPVSTETGTVVFFEERPATSKKAHICCLEFDQQGKPLPATHRVVLEEPFHLSYPFYFFYAEQHWMIPESAAANALYLYRCTQFPDQWERTKVLLQDVQVYDATVVEWDGWWYLFCTQKIWTGISPHACLHIYYTDNPVKGDWVAHPANPVYIDDTKARPAGHFIKHQNRLIRPSQQCAPVYGYGIQFFEVEELTPTSFKERLIESIEPNWDAGIRAVHTCNQSAGMQFLDAQRRLPFYKK